MGGVANAEITESVPMECACCGGIRDHRVTFVLTTALSRGGISEVSAESPEQRVRVLKCGDCGKATRVNAS